MVVPSAADEVPLMLLAPASIGPVTAGELKWTVWLEEPAEVWPLVVTVEVTTSPGLRVRPPQDQTPPLTVAPEVQVTGVPFT